MFKLLLSCNWKGVLNPYCQSAPQVQALVARIGGGTGEEWDAESGRHGNLFFHQQTDVYNGKAAGRVVEVGAKRHCSDGGGPVAGEESERHVGFDV